MNPDGLDLALLHQRVAIVEVDAADAGRRRSVIRELDRLAEHLVGHHAPEVQSMKRRIQELVVLVVPERHQVGVYIEIYCGR